MPRETLASLRVKIRGLEIENRRYCNQIAGLYRELDEAKGSPPGTYSRFEVSLSYGDGTLRWTASDPVPKSVAEARVNELRALGYNARMLETVREMNDDDGWMHAHRPRNR